MNHSDINEAKVNLREATDFVNAFIHKETLEFKKVPSQNDLSKLISACQYIKSEGATWQNVHYGMILDRIRHINLN